MNFNPFISIIVPVYNVECYLNKCIDSIIKQTNKEFELILVDDGSTDGSSKICDTYSKIDERIRVFHINNEGVSNARNYGINNAKGRYIMFVDSDDYIEDNTIEVILNNIDDYDMLIVGQTKDFYKNNYLKYQEKESNLEADIIIEDIKNNIKNIFDNIKMDSACCKVYRKSIISDNILFFNKGVNIREDTIFNIKYLQFCNNLKAINKYLYHFRINSEINYIAKRRPQIINCDYLYEELYCFIKKYNITKKKDLDSINKIIFNFYYEYILYFYKTFNEEDKIEIIKNVGENLNFQDINIKYMPKSKFLKIIKYLLNWKRYYLVNLIFTLRFKW